MFSSKEKREETTTQTSKSIVNFHCVEEEIGGNRRTAAHFPCKVLTVTSHIATVVTRSMTKRMTAVAAAAVMVLVLLDSGSIRTGWKN